MRRTKQYRITMKKNKFKKRKRAISSYGRKHTKKVKCALSGEKEGPFNKCHYGALGNNVKTKTKNSYATYRHKGGYGKACVYSQHDKAQITYMDRELMEYSNTNMDCLSVTEKGIKENN